MTARCAACRKPLTMATLAQHKDCAGPQSVRRRVAFEAEKPKGRSHFNAKATVCERGHRHPSRVEARVCASVYATYGHDPSLTIYRNVRLPLWTLPPTDAGIPHYCNVDFAVLGYIGHESKNGLWKGLVALIDAKSGRRSRDWERGRAAVEATYGVKVEEQSQ